MIKSIITLACFILAHIALIAQESVGINTTSPHPSAVLDIESTDKGVLIPRLDSASRVAIISPANGLMVYDITVNAFYYFDGSAWSKIGQSSWTQNGNHQYHNLSGNVGVGTINPSEKLEVVGKTKTNNLQVTNGATSGYILQSDTLGNASWVNPDTLSGAVKYVGTSYLGLNSGTGSTGSSEGSLSNRGNILIGNNAGDANTTGSQNIGIGTKALNKNATGGVNISIGHFSMEDNNSGYENTAIGQNSLSKNTTGLKNVALGHYTLDANTIGDENTAVGTEALGSNTIGSYNVGVGFKALSSVTSGIHNVGIGHFAGLYNNGTGNIFLGYFAGGFEEGNNKLYISNNSSSTPLIKGDFSTKKVIINDSLETKYFQLTDGAINGYVLQSDNYGYASWVNPLSIKADTSSFIADEDGNTRVETEKNPNENIIRFTLNDTSFFSMKRGVLEFDNPGSSVYIGQNSGNADTYTFANTNNVGVGNNTLRNLNGNSIATIRNTAIGTNALQNLNSASGNANSNTAIGYSAMNAFTGSGSSNVAIGQQAGVNKSTGSGNVFLGSTSGANNTNGSGNVFLGNSSGFNETGSNKLYIENSSSSTPLIYGDFSTNKVIINDSLATEYFQLTNGAINGYVLQSDGNGNANWVNPLSIKTDTSSLIADEDGNTRVEVEQTANDNLIRFIQNGTEYHRMFKGTLEFNNTGKSIYIGNASGLSDSLDSDKLNVGVGANALQNNVTGVGNVTLGNKTLQSLTSGSNNIAIGNSTMNQINSGQRNTAVGAFAGYNNTSGSRNIFLGNSAGQYEQGSDKLYISNSDTHNPLIKGDFVTKKVIINDSLETKYFQLTNGAINGYVLQSDGNGNANWVNPLTIKSDTLTLIADADGDTRVEVEQTANDNLIRFIQNDIEYHRFSKGTLEFNNTGKSIYIGSGAGLNDPLNFESENVGVGANSLQNILTGFENVTIGSKSLQNLSTGVSNTAVGQATLRYITNGQDNTAVGAYAGLNNLSGSNNVFLGYSAGYNELGSNKLYISNSNTSTPLIKGDFSTKKVTINDSLETKYFQLTNGAGSGFVLQSDINGQGTWVNSTNLLGANSLNTNILPKWNGNSFTNSLLSENGDYTLIGNPATGNLGMLSFPKLITTSNSSENRDIGGLLSTSDNFPMTLAFGKSRGSVTTPAAVQNGDFLAKFSANGFTGSDYKEGGNIEFAIDGTVNNTSLPTSFKISTTSEYSTEPTERLRINNNGNIGIGTTSPFGKLHIVGNTTIDAGKLKFINTGHSVFVGDQAGTYDDLTHNENVFIGHAAGRENVTGALNTYIGNNAGLNNTSSNNVAVGQAALEANTTGGFNTALGRFALGLNATGSFNTAVGVRAGLNAQGSHNVFLGTEAGQNETQSNKLYIANSNTTNPLIYGEFDNNLLRINGSLNINNAYTLPTNAGTLNYILQTDGAGTTSWIDPLSLKTDTLSLIADADGDTRVEVEQTSNDNLIRFIQNDIEYHRMFKGTLEFNNTGKSIYIGHGSGLNDPLTEDLENVGVGANSLQNNSGGIENVTMGTRSLQLLTSGVSNTAIGHTALRNLTTGGNNTAVGAFAGLNSSTGMNNVFLGFFAGANESGSNKLYISNSDTPTPLIKGDFSTNQVNINGNMNVGTNNLPTSTLGVNGSFATKFKTPLVAGTTHPDATGMTWRYTSGTGTITLPAASTCTDRIYIIINQTGSTRTLSQYRDLVTNIQTTLGSSQALWLQSDGNEWWQIK